MMLDSLHIPYLCKELRAAYTILPQFPFLMHSGQTSGLTYQGHPNLAFIFVLSTSEGNSFSSVPM